MSFGFAIRNPSGRLWMSPEVSPMNLIERLTITAAHGATFTTSIPKDIPIMIFVSYAKKVNTYMFEQTEVSGFHAYKISGGVFIFYPATSGIPEEYKVGNHQTSLMTVYVFAAMAKKTTRYGLAIYNASGRLVYSAQMRPLQLCHYQTNHTKTIDIDMKESIAVAPMHYSMTGEENNEGDLFDWYTTYNYWVGAYKNSVYNALTIKYEFAGIINDFNKSNALSGFFYIKTAIYDK